MQIEVLYRRPFRRWQRRLIEALRADGHDIVCSIAREAESLPFGLEAVLHLQRRAFGKPPWLFDVIEDSEPHLPSRPTVDLLLALDGTSSAMVPRLEPLFDDRPGSAAMIGALTRHGSPVFRVGLTTSEGRTDLVSAHLAIEDLDVLARALDQTLARMVTILVQAVRRYTLGVTTSCASRERSAERSPSPLMHGARGVARKLVRRLQGSRRHPAHWRIAYRRHAGAAWSASDWGSAPFTIVPDDKRRFLADPMGLEIDGRHHVFFEDFPYATGKGRIATVTIDRDGAASQPRAVLDLPIHLSYPFLFRHDGQIYMLPEMSAARRVQLFRADPFPDSWLADRTLLDGHLLGDATPIFHEGRWWLFATSADDGGSSWDQLCLFHAPDLFGPWTAHIDNPVLVDAGSARPAGAMWHEDGILMRVAQDCRRGYGDGLAICRVERLDPECFRQTVVRRLEAPAATRAEGLHTFSRIGEFEVIDLRYPSHR